ncbi:propionate catabolism operon regulatory protein PrpR [Methylibium rhizosphaerae]|uniref:propionate catabolism operon regulatory protein PrpR n=1 Tax=Methylibium rhizosphaerae TaxID=2570323 RepID=UPI00112C48D6|nr:propionate catabolism operon regulatory protein PrpR [Methylibium rhizosphaerae]
MKPAFPAQRQPRIVAVGFHRLRSLLLELAPAFHDQAQVEVLDKGFEEAVAEVRARQAVEPIDVLVSAGSNGAFLRQHLELPVVLVKVGGYDVMRALGRARAISPRIAMVAYGEPSPEVQQFNERFGLGVVQRAYRTEEEARDCVRELRALHIEVVVAPGLVADLAEEAGMTGVFLYSQDAVREALDDAVEIARVGRIEQAKRERLNTILAQLKDGVVAVDLQERIETLNPAMEQLLGAAPGSLLGRRLSEVAPELSLAGTLADARAELERVQQLGLRTLVASRMPIVEQGRQTGAVLTCQDPVTIHRVDRNLRASRTPRGGAGGPTRYTLEQIVGASDAIRRTKALAAASAASDATVLISGESGTGKELLAQGIHNASRRRRQPFVAVNCAAFPEALLESELFGYEEGAFTGSRRGGKAGLFEAAHTGTLFLDEVGEMPVPLQTRLLRVLQEREILRIGSTEPTPVDVRVIAATHRDLQAQVACGAFRRDLYYRLNILRLALPPLRERRDDVPLLAAQLLDKIARRLQADTRHAAPLVQALLEHTGHYAWPGNVRELENLIERVVVYSGSHAAPHTPHTPQTLLQMLGDIAPEVFERAPAANVAAAAPVGAPASLQATRKAAERQRVLDVLEACNGNRAQACRQLGISRATLWRKLNAG